VVSVRVQAHIVDLARILRAIPRAEVARRRAACAVLYRAVIGETDEPAFRLALRLWSLRVSHALAAAAAPHELAARRDSAWGTGRGGGSGRRRIG